MKTLLSGNSFSNGNSTYNGRNSNGRVQNVKTPPPTRKHVGVV